MHVNRGMLGWGVFLIALGGVPAAVRDGLVDASVASRAWELWPLLLVGVGLGLALARTPAAIAGGVVVALVFGLMGGGLIAAGIGNGGGLAICGSGSTGQASTRPAAHGTFTDVADVQLSVDCGSLTLDAADGRDWSVGWASDDGRLPVIDAAADRLGVRAASRTGLGIGVAPSTWNVTLPRDPTLTVQVSVNAGTARAAFAGLHLDTLDLSVNAGDARLDLGGTTGLREVDASANFGSLAVALPRPDGVLEGTISANAGSVRLCTPEGTLLVIHAGDQPLGSNNFASRGMTKSGNTWTRGNPVADTRLDLNIDANLGSITLDPEDGCG